MPALGKIWSPSFVLEPESPAISARPRFILGTFAAPGHSASVTKEEMTNDWYRLTFSADDISAAKHLETEGHFQKFFLAADSPEDATLFKGLEPGQMIYYFSPGAARIAMKLITHLSAVQCPAPPMSAVAFIAGHQAGL